MPHERGKIPCGCLHDHMKVVGHHVGMNPDIIYLARHLELADEGPAIRVVAIDRFSFRYPGRLRDTRSLSEN